MALDDRILVIAPQPFFSPRGTPFSVYYRTLIMAEMGLKIDMVTYGQGLDVDLPNLTIHRIPAFSQIGDVRIGPSIHKLFLDIFIFFLTLRLLLKNSYSLVHTHEEAVFFCIFLKPIFQFKLLYDMHSSLPQQLTNFNFTTSKFIIGIFQMLENLALKVADAVITICPDLAKYVDGVIEDKSKHVMIENSLFDAVKLKYQSCSGNRFFAYDQYEKLVSQLSSQSELIVYAGTLEPYQGIDILLPAMKIVCRHRKRAKLLIVGGTPEQVCEYEQLADRLGIRSAVTFSGQVPHQVALKLIRLATVQVSPRSTGTNTPLKIYAQLASGIPLVATNIYSHTQTIDQSVAFLVDPTAESMAQGLLKALNSKETAHQIAQAAQHHYQKTYSRPVYKQKMITVMRKVGLCVASVE